MPQNNTLARDAMALAQNTTRKVNDHIKIKDNSYLIYPIVVFVMTILVYLGMELNGIKANEYTRTGALIVTGFGALAAIVYYFMKKGDE